MSFTTPLTGNTIVITAAVVTTCSASVDCTGSAIPACSGDVCVAMSFGSGSFTPMENHSQHILAASLGTKFPARRVQERCSTATSFREQISSAEVKHVPRELEVIAREWESLNAEDAHDPELACTHRDGQCRKAVMWYVHHLPESTKEVIRDRASLPPRSFATMAKMGPMSICVDAAFWDLYTYARGCVLQGFNGVPEVVTVTDVNRAASSSFMDRSELGSVKNQEQCCSYWAFRPRVSSKVIGSSPGNLSRSSKEQPVDCDMVVSAGNDDLVNNGFAYDKKNTTCIWRPVTATPQRRVLASFELYCGHHPRNCHGIQGHVHSIDLQTDQSYSSGVSITSCGTKPVTVFLSSVTEPTLALITGR